MTPTDRARAAASAMWRDDGAAQWMGITLDRVDEATATLSLTVAAHHCNGFGICHGGVTFTLADTAFAYACNSRNQRTVAQHNVISYIAPARSGDRLTATATEVSLTGRSGIYDVAVTDQTGRLIASFRGMSRAIEGTLFKETR